MRVLLAALLMLVGGAAGAAPVTLPGPGGLVLRADLALPSGLAVAPAVVALHGCGGPYPARDDAWVRALVAAGHIVLRPDSFGSRGLGPQCRERHRVATSGGLRRQDAIAAMRWLAARPGTPAGGIALLGWSDGGSTVVATLRAAPDLPAGLLRRAVAFYPGCRGALHSAGWRPAAPLLILHGAADDWTPVAPCLALADKHPGMVMIHTYPGAYHDFDSPVKLHRLHHIPTSQNLDHSVHLGGDPAAREDAFRRVPAWLER